MANSRTFNPQRQLIHPLEIYAGGWKADSVTLEREGWRFEMDSDHVRMMERLFMWHPRGGGVAFFMDMRLSDLMRAPGRLITLDHPWTHLRGGSIDAMLPDRTPVFMQASMVNEFEMVANNRYSVNDIFQTDGTYADEPEQEIVVVDDPKTVDDLLDEILKAQMPEQTAIRERMRKRKRRRASIVTLEDVTAEERARYAR